MKNHLLFACVAVFVVFLSQVPVASDECYPPGTVFRWGCPGETVVSSNCVDCNPFNSVHSATERCGVRKSEKKEYFLG